MCSINWRASAILGASGSSCTPSSSKSVSALVSLPKVSCARFAASSGILFFLRFACAFAFRSRSEEHTSELQSQSNLVCRLLLEKKKKKTNKQNYLITQKNNTD